jgi:hypothetical protein
MPLSTSFSKPQPETMHFIFILCPNPDGSTILSVMIQMSHIVVNLVTLAVQGGLKHMLPIASLQPW